MDISLTPELEQFVEKTVKNGNFFGASEVICEALQTLKRLLQTANALAFTTNRKR